MANPDHRPDAEEDQPFNSRAFSHRYFPDHLLRDYQFSPAQAIFDSVWRRLGKQHIVVFSRQAGKDELLAQTLCQILLLHHRRGGNAIIVAPSFRPQGATMRERLIDRAQALKPLVDVRSRDGHVVQVGNATARFLSASPLANARGQTADLLLVANEAQDIRAEVWDTVFDPMAATTNATTVFMGTVWSRDTLLARQMRYLEQVQQASDQRVWKVTWEEVARHLPAYGAHVQERIAQLGRDHPSVKTEYFLEELDSAGALFTERHIAQMQGDHPRRRRAEAGGRYALLIDVGGESESPLLPGTVDWAGRRDSTAVTVVEICESTGRGDGQLAYGALPVYRVIDRMAWTGVSHVSLHSQIVDLARNVWRATVVIVDGTGIGAGLAAFLRAGLGRRADGAAATEVVSFGFTSASKSALGWDFVALIESGRYKEYAESAPAGSDDALLTEAFWAQLRSIAYDVLPGPGLSMRWGTPSGRGHDDLVVSAALTAALDRHDLRPRIARGS